MSQPPLEETRKLVAEDPQLLAYLPMLYVAWADGDLSADEIGSICSTVTRALDTEANCRGLLGRWLDPAIRNGLVVNSDVLDKEPDIAVGDEIRIDI